MLKKKKKTNPETIQTKQKIKSVFNCIYFAVFDSGRVTESYWLCGLGKIILHIPIGNNKDCKMKKKTRPHILLQELLPEHLLCYFIIFSLNTHPVATQKLWDDVEGA